MFFFVAFITGTCTFMMKLEDSNAEFAMFPFYSYHLMQNCWKRYSSERPHFQQIVTTLTKFLDHLNECDSVYHDSDSDEAPDFARQGSGKELFLLYKCINKNSQHPPSSPLQVL